MKSELIGNGILLDNEKKKIFRDLEVGFGFMFFCYSFEPNYY